MKNFIIKHKYKITIFFYLTISLLLTITHEPWRDEAQQWLMCRDLNLVGIIKQLKYEGHFLLWYLILFPFVKIGFPYFFQNILSWIISGIGGILFLKKTPFKFWKKLLVIFSPAYLYYFSAISRCYCLIPLGLFLIITTYKNRFKQPLHYLLSIVFLANIHTFLLGIAGILLLDYYTELFILLRSNKKVDNSQLHFNNKTNYHVKNFLIVILLLILSILPLISSVFVNKSIGRGMTFGELFAEFSLGLPLSTVKWIFSFINTDITIYIVIMFLIELFIISIFTYNKKICLYSIIYSIYFFLLASLSVGLNSQKVCVLYAILLLIFTLFKGKSTGTEPKKFNIFYGLAFINVFTALFYYKYDLLYSYTQAKEVANYFNNFNEDIILLTGNQREMISSVIPYLNNDVKVYDIQFEDFTTYTIFDYHVLNTISEEDIDKAIEKIGEDKKYYYIYFPEKTRPVTDIETITSLVNKNKIELINKFDNSFAMNEKYWIYRIIQ